MKYALVYYLLLFSLFQINAQQDSSSCKKIVTIDGRELIVKVDTVDAGYLYYRKCLDSISGQRRMPIGYVQTIKEYGDTVKTTDLGLDTLIKPPVVKNEVETIKRWTFRRKIQPVVKTISEGQKVKVTYLSPNGKKRKARGRLKNMTQKTMVVRSKKGQRFVIPKMDVQKITYSDPLKKVVRILGILVVIIGFGLVTWWLGAALADGTAFILSGGGDPEFRGSIGCLIPTITLIGGFFLLFASKSSIDLPFTDAWEITEPMVELEIENNSEEP